MTENHNYNQPSEGTRDWHIPLNENFAALDTDIEVRDDESALDTYSPDEHAKFFAVDTGAVYLGDGTSWNYVGTVDDSEGSGSGMNPQSADWVVSNDADMGQAASGATDGDFIYITNGFETSGTHVFDSTDNLTIMGRHFRNTKLQNGSESIFEFRNCQRVRLSRLHFNGKSNNTESLVAFRNGFGTINYNQFIHDCRFGDSRGNGLLWNSIHDSTIFRCEFFGLGDTSLSTFNLKIEDTGEGCRGNQIADCRFERNGTTGTPAGHFYMNNLQQSAIRGCKFHEGQEASPDGLVVSGGGNHRTHFVGSYFFADYGSDLINWTDSDKGVISSCVFYGNADTALRIGNNKTVSSCLFDGGMNEAISGGSNNLITCNRITSASESITTTGSSNLVAVNVTPDGTSGLNLSDGTTSGLNI